jgi:hypothetical protein
MNITSTKRYLLLIALISVFSSFGYSVYSQPKDQQKFNCSGIYMVSTTEGNIESRRVPYGTDAIIFYSPFFKSYSIVFQAEDGVSELKFKYVGEMQGQSKYYLEDGGDLQYFYTVYTVDEMVQLGKQKFLSATTHNGKNVWFYLEGISSMNNTTNNLTNEPSSNRVTKNEANAPNSNKRKVFYSKNVVVEYVTSSKEPISSLGNGRDGYLSYDNTDNSFFLMYTLNGIDYTDKLVPSKQNNEPWHTNGNDNYQVSGAFELNETMIFLNIKPVSAGQYKCISFTNLSLVVPRKD